MIFSEEEVVIDSEMIVESEVVEVTTETLYCVCKQPWDKNNKKFMIQCDCCKEWFHGDCVGLAEYLAKDIDKYHCGKCEIGHGPSISIATNNDEVMLERYKKPGTIGFIEELKSKSFESMDKIVKVMRGQNLLMPELFKKGFDHPILVPEVDGLDIKVPPGNFTVHDVSRYVGPDKVVDVIDVRIQKDFQMTMGQFTYYFTKPGRTKPYNLISLEFSETNLSKFVEPPYIARKLDWVYQSWPKNIKLENVVKPVVSKYCLVSPEGSYTDFHVDFGGTSVWYHVLWGEKVFYFFQPTQENLASYNRWMSQNDKSAANFLGDLISDACYECTLKKGQTLFIPTGWIHAVYTPVDSLVFGGNFLHYLNMDLQLQIYSMEKNLKIPLKYIFPSFEVTHWFAAEAIIDGVLNVIGHSRLPPYLLRGIKALHDTLKVWSMEKEPNKSRREVIPRCINIPRTLKGLSRLIKLGDRKDVIKQQDGNSELKKIFSKKDGASNVISKKANKDPLKMVISRVSTNSEVPSSSTQESVPIKLKIRRHSGSSSGASPAHPLSYLQVKDPAEKTQKLEIDVGSAYDFDTKPLQHNSPPIIIRFNVSEAKAELVDSNSNAGSDTLQIVESDREDLKIDTDQSNHSMDVKIQSRSKSKRKHHHKSKCKKKQNSVKARNMTIDDELAGTLNGIEELMKSSNYTERIENCTTLKPQVKTAIKDMLEIQDEILPLKKRLGHKKKHVKNGKLIQEDDFELDIEKVHQDDDYIYLPLAGGSDDEERSSKRGKKRGRPRETDVPWSPRIKVGKVSARDERPARDKAKRKSVEKGLEKAAASLSEKKIKHKALSTEFSEKIKPIKVANSKKHTLKQESKPKSKALLPSSEASTSAGPSSLSVSTPVVKRPKKGFATPKQRLGKILGIKFPK